MNHLRHICCFLRTSAFLLLVTLFSYPVIAQLSPPAQNPAPAAFDPSLPDAPSSSQAAGGNSFVSDLGHGVLTIGKDELVFIKAPFDPKNFKWDLLVVAVAAPLIATDEHVAHAVNPAWHANSITVSNDALYANAAAAGGIFVTGLLADNDHAKDTGVATARGMADSVIMYGALKAILARERPFSGEGEGKFFSGNWKSGSFPSGHSMFNWTVASVIAHEYPKWPVELAVYSLATATSTGRVTAGVHFPSDVVVGGIFGYLIGRYAVKQGSHWPGDHPARSQNRFMRVEDAVLSHVSIGGQ